MEMTQAKARNLFFLLPHTSLVMLLQQTTPRDKEQGPDTAERARVSKSKRRKREKADKSLSV